jgi:glycosyltransferase involved in cell wall biosynthesis
LANSAPKILFIPVSGRFGMGEYARSLAIASAARVRWPGAAIQFVLSRQAPYAENSPFPATLLPSSPTFHSARVAELIDRWRPDLVIFDNAGRNAQLRAARRVGARVVFISARRRQRRKAFRWRWMRMIDEHWIAYPEFIAGGLGLLEKLKLKWIGRPVVRYLDVILSRPDPAQQGTILSRAGLIPGSFVLFVPGGGTGHPGAHAAVGQFLAAAHSLAARAVPTVYVGPAATNAIDAAHGRNWHPLGPLPQAELAELMRSARLIVANGGSTLLQAIACGSACIAVPIAKDQFERTRRCVEAGAAVAAEPGTAGILQAAEQLLENEPARAALAGCAARLGLADGVDIALAAMAGLVDLAQTAAP